jgi:hypothetical protein
MAIALILLMGTLYTAEAGKSLVIRLVLAHNTSEKVHKGLADVQKTLTENLPYTGFDLQDQKRLPLPGGGQVQMRHNIKLTASGGQESLTVRVRQKRRPFVNTTLKLTDGRPVILGGIPSKRGRLLVVIIAR